MSDNFRTSLHGFRIAKQMESISTSCLISLALDLSVTWKQLARVLELDDEVERIAKTTEEMCSNKLTECF